jgi:hypothetical protein
MWHPLPPPYRPRCTPSSSGSTAPEPVRKTVSCARALPTCGSNPSIPSKTGTGVSAEPFSTWRWPRMSDGPRVCTGSPVSCGGDITEWLEWSLNVHAEACRATSRSVDEPLLRARFWSDHKGVALNERQRQVINKMLEAGPGRSEGRLTLRKYVRIAATSRASAFRDIEDLVKNRIAAGRGHGTGNALRPGAARLGMETGRQRKTWADHKLNPRYCRQ